MEAPLRACHCCIATGQQCVSLFIPVWTADCEESNKQAMVKLLEMKEKGTATAELQLLVPLPEATHVAKCLKGSFANWFLFKAGERFNLSNLRVLYNDPDHQLRKRMRAATILSAVRNRDRMSVPDLLIINKESVRAILREVKHTVQTLIPEPFRLYKGNARGVLSHPTGLCIAPQGKLLICDHSKSRLFQGRLHYPVDVSELSSNLKNPNGVACLNSVVYVADTGNNRVAFLIQNPGVLFRPNNMRVDDLRQRLEERGVPSRNLNKKELVKRMNEWIKTEQRRNNVDINNLSSLPLNVASITPLALCGCGDDLMFLSDLQSNSIKQVTIENNGAVLKGTVVSVMHLEQGVLPYGISVFRNKLYVADSRDQGGLIRFDLSNGTSTVVVKNQSAECQRIHSVAVTSGDDVIFTDRDAKKIKKFSNGTVTEIAGSGSGLSQDGSAQSASFVQPTAICIEENTIYVCDTAVGRVCIVSPMSSLSSYLEQNDTICKTFGIHLRGTPPEIFTVSQGIDKLRGVSSWFNSWERETRESLGRTGAVQGPQGISSSKSISSVNIITESLQSLKETIEYVNSGYLNQLRLASLLTLVVEHLFSKMRSRNPTPTVLEYAYLFGPTMKESVKQLTKCGFHYFTARSSFYELPENGCLSLNEVPSIPQLPGKSMSLGDQRVLCDWRDNYGQSVPQVTVRNQSTKDNVGTLPLYSYTQPAPVPQPLAFLTSGDVEAHSDNNSTANVLFQCQTLLAVKPSLVAGVHGFNSSRFLLGVVTATIVQNEHESHLNKIDIYLPSENDIFTYTRNCTVDLPKEAVILVLERNVPVGEKEIVLTEEVFEGLTALTNGENDQCTESGGQLGVLDDVAGMSDEDDDEMEDTVCVDTIVLRTSSRGRQIRRPHRLDL